jgi:hypothetical protein
VSLRWKCDDLVMLGTTSASAATALVSAPSAAASARSRIVCRRLPCGRACGTHFSPRSHLRVDFSSSKPSRRCRSYSSTTDSCSGGATATMRPNEPLTVVEAQVMPGYAPWCVREAER